MITEALDFRFLLLENYKRLKITENELVTLFMIDHLISLGNPFVTADLLAIKMSLDVKEIDKVLSTLLIRGLISYVTQGQKTITSLEPIKKKLFKEFQIVLTNEDQRETNLDIDNQLKNIYQQYSEILGRSLRPVEIQKIGEWVSHGFNDGMIIDALKESMNKGRKSFSSIDKILLSWASRDDRENEGINIKSEEWNRSLEETIRIAKTPWIDKDED